MTESYQLEIAPFLLARVGCCAPVNLNKVCLPLTVQHINDGIEIADLLESFRPALTDALHRLVPSLEDDRRLRRVVLALRRDIHNMRLPSLKPVEEAAVRRRLPPDTAASFESWMHLAHQRQICLEQAAWCLPDETQLAAAALYAVVTDPELQRGLALASPEFLKEVIRSEPSTLDSRFLRSCFTYLVRASVKTSPFSTLTQVGLARIRPCSERRISSHL